MIHINLLRLFSLQSSKRQHTLPNNNDTAECGGTKKGGDHAHLGVLDGEESSSHEEGVTWETMGSLKFPDPVEEKLGPGSFLHLMCGNGKDVWEELLGIRTSSSAARPSLLGEAAFGCFDFFHYSKF